MARTKVESEEEDLFRVSFVLRSALPKYGRVRSTHKIALISALAALTEQRKRIQAYQSRQGEL